MIPLRIQRKRTKGWRMPPDTVSVTRPGKWGNPFRVDRDGDAATCVKKYKAKIGSNFWTWPTKYDIKRELQGKNLACFCKLCDKHKDGKPLNVRCSDCGPCHADVLGELANGFVCEAAA